MCSGSSSSSNIASPVRLPHANHPPVLKPLLGDSAFTVLSFTGEGGATNHLPSLQWAPSTRFSWNALGHPGKQVLLSPPIDEETEEAVKPPVGTQQDFFFVEGLGPLFPDHEQPLQLPQREHSLYAHGPIPLHKHLTGEGLLSPFHRWANQSSER